MRARRARLEGLGRAHNTHALVRVTRLLRARRARLEGLGSAITCMLKLSITCVL